MGTIRKAKRSSGPDLELSRSELQALPARLLTKLPVETRIFVQAAGTKTEFVFTTALDAPAHKPRGERRRPCWLAASELDALVLGVETERVFASDLTGFALRKLHDPKFRITEEHALGGAQHPGAWQSELGELDERGGRPAMTVGEVLAVLDLEITGIELGPLAPAVAPDSIPARAA
jgi:hypothetical protein